MSSNFIPMVYAVLKDRGIDTKGLSVEDAIKKYNELTGKSGVYDTESGEEKQVKDNGNIVELSDNSELARLIVSSDKNKYDTIRRYLIDNFGGKELELSDGKKAIVDNKDAKELSHKADGKRIAELSELETLVKKAKFLTQVDDVQHKKFKAFRYYTTGIQYKGEKSEIVLNVGVEKSNQRLHLYAITNRPLKQ